jgi:hypothetical protein
MADCVRCPTCRVRADVRTELERRVPSTALADPRRQQLVAPTEDRFQALLLAWDVGGATAQEVEEAIGNLYRAWEALT